MEMKSVTRSLRILEAVAQHQPVTVGELTKLFGLPKSTVQRTLVTLAEAGWLRANPPPAGRSAPGYWPYDPPPSRAPACSPPPATP
ncbi:helix-turn-helix domain-containing protein [Streptomyces sp. MMG1533]|uniref:helix-turn-helix domain-containing protein n=1 Tax=Streptomyces sp. MMG1533 TaxID=1415546 RepID=UPI000A4ED87E|nr:helix-turn-helix domain-containing protein [Streptomyces sp. MMG1533]